MDYRAKIWEARDQHHDFSDLATSNPWLADLERRVRNARPRNRQHLHRGFDEIRRQTAHLRLRHQLTANGHLSRVLDDAAALHWRKR